MSTTEVLVVEDEAAQRELMFELLSESSTIDAVHLAEDGVEAMEFLNSRADGGVLPAIVILDLNLPRKDGRTVLREVKAHPRLRHVRVVVLSGSTNAADIALAYGHLANCYVRKPDDLEGLRRVVRFIEEFWLGVAEH